MIPMLAIVKVKRMGGRTFALWLPLFLVWLLFLPFALVLLPVLIVALAWQGIDIGAGLGALARLFCSLNGTIVEVESAKAEVLVRIQ